MAKDWTFADGPWTALFLSCLICHTVISMEAHIPLCFTDYARELICHWEVNVTTNCSEFQLRYTTDGVQNDTCVPKKESKLTSACCCTYTVPTINLQWSSFHFSLDINGKTIWTQSFASRTLAAKPRPLINVAIEKTDRRSYVLTWKRNYSPTDDMYDAKACHEVEYGITGESPKIQSITSKKASYEVFATNLKTGRNYSARVRYRLERYNWFWSEWSTPCEWTNDLKPEPGDHLWIIVLWVCAFLMAFIFTCYFCLNRMKRSWWDRIPNPAKSMVAKDKPAKPFSAVKKVGEYKTSLYYVGQTVSQEQLCQKEQAEKSSGPGRTLKVFPEETSIMQFVAQNNSAMALAAAQEIEDYPAPHEDDLACLFMDILNTSLSAEDPEIPAVIQEGQLPSRDQLSGFSSPQTLGQGLSALGIVPVTSIGQHKQRSGRECSEESFESGFGSSGVGALPPNTNLCHPEAQPNMLVFPEKLSHGSCRPMVTDGTTPLTDCQVGGTRTTVPQPSGYKSFNSLVSNLVQASDHPLVSYGTNKIPVSGSDARCPFSFSSTSLESPFKSVHSRTGSLASSTSFSSSSSSFSSCEPEADDAPALLPWEDGNRGATFQNDSGEFGAVSCPPSSTVSGYRPLSSTLLSKSALDSSQQSPYKPLLGMLRNNPTESRAGRIPFAPPCLAGQEAPSQA